jgi:mono/diheme cytochrome c family protein
MNERLLKTLIAVSLVVLLSTLLTACGGGDQQQDEGQSAPETLDGEALVKERCTQCHDLGTATGGGRTKEEWQATVERMVSKGADLDAEEQAAVVEYLAETYP